MPKFVNQVKGKPEGNQISASQFTAIPGTGTHLLCLFYSDLSSEIINHVQFPMRTYPQFQELFTLISLSSIYHRTEVYSFEAVMLKPTKRLEKLE